MTPEQARTLLVSATNPIEKAWRASHHLLEKTSCASLFSADELFEIFVRARARGQTGPGTVYFNHEIGERVFSRQGNVPTPIEHMPMTSDGSFAGYSERISRTLSSGRFILRITEAQAYSLDVWKRFCRFLRPLEEAVLDAARSAGVDPSTLPSVKTTTFVGNYDFTPFGIHVDPYPQIQCVTLGHRSALFWTNDYCAKSLDEAKRLRPWEHLEAATKIDMHAGDAVYWPAFEEHAFSSSAGFAIAVTISFQTIPRTSNNNDEERREEMAMHRSAHGFVNFPRERPTPGAWKRNQRFRTDPIFPLTCFQTKNAEGGEENAIIAAGSSLHLGDLPSHALETFIARANRAEESFEATNVMQDLDFNAEDAHGFLDVLYASNFIEAVP